jgi:hypothetical protein
METPNLDRIRFVTRHFQDLQGLRHWAPLGLITLSLGLATGFASRPMSLLASLLFAGSLFLRAGAGRYYRNYFGKVERQAIDPLLDTCPASMSVFSPAGSTPRLEGVQLIPPMARYVLATAAPALILFSAFQAIPPAFLVDGREALGQHPQVLSQPHGRLERPWIIGDQPQPSDPFEPPWVAWIYSRVPTRPPSALRAVFGQTMYVLYGSVFLGVWLWRGRRRSQGHHLALAILLLGLSALGASLGFQVQEGGEIPRIFDALLPALVYPGVALLLCGSSMVLAGLLDHRQLARALG